MNKNKSFKKVLILFIFIIAIVAIIAPNKILAASGKTEVIASAVNGNLSGDSFDIKFSYLSGGQGNTWWILCNEHGTPFREVVTHYTKTSENNESSTVRAYILSDLDNYNAKGYYRNTSGQNAWWGSASNNNGDSVDTMWISEVNMTFTTTGENKLIDLVISGDIVNKSETEIKKELKTIIKNYGSKEASTKNINDLYDILVNLYTKINTRNNRRRKFT